MSVIDLTCPNCRAAVHAPAWLAGKHTSCRRCDSRIDVPPASDSPGAVPGGTLGMPDAPAAEPGGAPESIDSPFVRIDAPPVADHGYDVVRTEPPDRTIPAIAGAAVGAVLGVVVWAAVGALTGYEIGWIAWGIGAGVGSLAVALGGRGNGVAVACAILTLLAIGGGKIAAIAYVLPHEVGKMMSSMISRDMYTEHSVDAGEFAALGAAPSDDDVREYMVRRGWFVEGEPWEIPDEFVATFRSDTAPELRTFHEEQPPYEAWRDHLVDVAVEELLQEVSTIDIVKEDLSGFDLLWVLLGVSSAFGLVMRRSQ